MSVSKAIPAVEGMRKYTAVVAPLMDGTLAMRAAGVSLLPKWPNEEDDAYKDRVAVSTLFPAYQETVANMTGRVFAEPITLGEDVPEKIKAQVENIDNAGNNLDVWGEDAFKWGLAKGIVFAHVDYPPTSGIRTQADEQAAGVRPYAVKIDVESVIGWKVSNGILTQFRYMEAVEEDDGEFGVKSVDQIRVLEIGSWRTYRREEGKSDADWKLHEEGNTTLKRIPIAVFYTGRTGFMTAKPPLLELAHLNVKHWQSQSDQDNILHVARVPILGMFTESDKVALTVGTKAAVKLGKEDDLRWVEHTGAAIGAGQAALDKLVDAMRQAGAKLLEIDRQGTKTVMQSEEDASNNTSPLQRMASGFEDFIDNILQFFAEWQGEASGGHCTVNGNFDQDYTPQISMPTLVSMANANMISKETLFEEMKRRRVLSPDREWDEERDRLDEQGPALGGLAIPVQPTNEPEDTDTDEQAA